MAKFYRVENKYGKGPYRCIGWFNFYYDHNNLEHPEPHEEDFNITLPNEISHLVFGFTSLKKLKIWFEKRARLELFNCNFSVSVYEINKEKEYYFSKRQAIAYTADIEPIRIIEFGPRGGLSI